MQNTTPRGGTGSTCRVGEHRYAGIPHIAKSPLWAFALLPNSLPMIVVLLVSCSMFPYCLILLQFPVLPVLSRTFPPKIPLSIPAYFLLHPYILSSHALPFPHVFPYPVLPMFVPHFPSQNSVEHVRSRYLLQRTYFPPVLSRIVDFTLSFFYCVCNTFFFTLCFTEIVLKNLFVIDYFLFVP